MFKYNTIFDFEGDKKDMVLFVEQLESAGIKSTPINGNKITVKPSSLHQEAKMFEIQFHYEVGWVE